MTTKPLKPYDPVAYQAELDARCGKVGTAWSPVSVGSISRMPRDQVEQHRAARREMKRLEAPIGEEWDSDEELERASVGRNLLAARTW